MIKNYFKLAWRTLLANKIFSAINVIGLTIGLSTCMLVATVVIDDLSYDTQWTKSNDLYRIITTKQLSSELNDRSNLSPEALNVALTENFPEVESAAAINEIKQRFKIDDNNPNGIEAVTIKADTTIWKMLDMKVIKGNPRNYINGTGNVVISKTFKEKYFAGEDPVGKTIYDVPTYSATPTPYVITGIIEDIPSNSVFRADVVHLQKPRNQTLHKKQYGTYTQVYLLLKPGTNAATFTQKLNTWYGNYVEVEKPFTFTLQSIKDIYLHSEFATYQSVKGDYKSTYIFSGIALLLLLIACVNYVNLTTSRALQKTRDIGVRKVLGAHRSQLMIQFLTESFLYFFIAAVLATLVYVLALPAIERFLGHQLTQTFLSHRLLLLYSYGIIIIASLIAGFYPAMMLSGFKPAATLKGRLFVNASGSQQLVKKSLVVLQFSLSVVVLIALIVIRQQVSFMNTKDLGYNKNNLLSIGTISWDGKGETFKNELLRQHGVENASITPWVPTQGPGYMSSDIKHPDNPDDKLTVWTILGDLDLAKTLGLQLEKGRFLEQSYAFDSMSQDSIMMLGSEGYQKAASKQSSLVTASTAKLLHVTLNNRIKNAQTTPVGIIKDFNNESLKNPMLPLMVIGQKSPNTGGMLVRVKPGYESQVTTSINKIWRDLYPAKLLNIQWVDDMLAAQYQSEQKTQQMFTFFCSLSMLLAALGIFGLILEAAAQRIKEIGVRKILGASVVSIIKLFSIDFLKLILLSIVIASPVAAWLMHKWLLDFAYQIEIEWWVFAVASLLAISIAMVTISVSAMKAALANPIKSLRTE